MERAFQLVATVVVVLPLMVPIGILYFLEPGKAVSLGVVIVFAIAAAFTMLMLIPGVRFDTIFLGTAAYMAVQVTFLANFQSACK